MSVFGQNNNSKGGNTGGSIPFYYRFLACHLGQFNSMNRIFTLLVFIGILNNFSLFSQDQEFKSTSLLAGGIIHRVAVSKSGVYKLDYNFIKDKLKIDPGSISTDRIIIAGNGAGRIPQWSATPRIDDLEQIASYGFGLEDGHFNEGDYLLWYAEGPEAWAFDTVDHVYNMDKNIYDNVNHYYIIINGPVRKQMLTGTNGTNADYVSDASQFYQRLEEEKVNLLGRYRPPGSGQEWYGDELAVLNQIDYTNKFDFIDFIPSDTFHFYSRFAVRNENVSRFYVDFDDHEFNRNVGGLGQGLGSFEASYANDATLAGTFIPGKSFTKILMRYPSANGADSKAWVDFLQINGWKSNLYHNGAQLWIVDPRSRYKGVPDYEVQNLPANAMIWDISDNLNPVSQSFACTAQCHFISTRAVSTIPSIFICFNPSTDPLIPTYEKVVENQDVHNLQRADLVIVYHGDFKEAAQLLAQHRRDHDHLIVETVDVSTIFEEFGGGSKDPSALRDFARMLYTRDHSFKYLLLMGDATYDYLNHTPDVPYQNFIPAFETEESLHPVFSFPSDDFYALLDKEEGNNLIGALDVAVGRLPVSTLQEAMDIVNKIIYYDTNPLTLGDWRNRIMMAADDEDYNIHLNQADGLAVKTNIAHPVYNEIKVYLDAYPQQSTPGGDRYPGVNNDLDLNINKGALTVTYMGHGGPNGWSQERVLGINQAQSYDNLENMPLFITATCSFAAYDEPGFTSAGEHLITNPNGGAIGLMTTVRAVYSGSNERLTDEVLKIIYDQNENGSSEPIGEILRKSKNANSIDTVDTNARKFTLLGDPALKLAIPPNRVAVREIQGQPVDINHLDTLNALGSAIVSGVILDHNDQVLTSFNGTLYLTVFDKVLQRRTLANDETSTERTFATQTRQLFKGTATVEAGIWTISFVLPKDIDFSFGNGKMSFYAEDGQVDAAGFFSDFVIGGVSEDGLSDDTPPVINLYMNDNHFIDGGITDANPDIYAELSDDHGINVSGTSIGHDIEAVLDGDDVHSFILNDYYQAVLDDHTRGTVRFPLTGLTPGLHTITMTAWDLANNPAQATIEFLVLGDSGPVITNVQNQPNPFSDETFFTFEHNRAGSLIDMQIDIFSTDGRLVNSLRKDGYEAGGYRVEDLSWSGNNQNGAEVPSGIYVYRLKATFTTNGNVEVAEAKAGKLVVLH